MGSQYSKLKEKDKEFIKKQKLFYLASSSGEEVNLSPKGYDSIRILDSNTLLYLDYPGSGNRTGRDIENGGNITIVFNSFVREEAKILRIFSKGEIIEKDSEKFMEYISLFGINREFIRQMFLFNISAVESSCGEAVPIMEFKEERSGLRNWAKRMSKNGQLEGYIEKHKVPPSLENL
jgi:hypothetical protein